MVAGDTLAALAIFDIEVSAKPMVVINSMAALLIASRLLSSLCLIVLYIINERSLIIKGV